MFDDFGVLSELLAATAKGGMSGVRSPGRGCGPSTCSATSVTPARPPLIIVSVVNFLIGAILAFVGAVQLRKFAADIYVAEPGRPRRGARDGRGDDRDRHGRAHRRRLCRPHRHDAGQRGDRRAHRCIGIPVADYILLPSILALVFTMPLLYLYGCLVGMLGGFVVAIAMLNITGPAILHQTLGAVPFDQFVFGFVKIIAFAILIGVTSCRIGLKAGRSAADVGVAATRAVVTGIVGVIALDAMFAVLADVVGI